MMCFCPSGLFTCTLTKREYPDERPHHAAFHLGLLYFPNTCLRVFKLQRVLKCCSRMHLILFETVHVLIYLPIFNWFINKAFCVCARSRAC